MKLKRGVAWLHRWLGLVIGLYISLIALSGVALVFAPQLFAWELGRGAVGFEERDAAWAPPSVWIANAEARYGELPKIEGIFGRSTIPIRLDAPTIVYSPPEGENHEHRHGIVTFDPYGGEPLAHFIAEDTASMWVLRIHNALFLGEEGHVLFIMTISALVVLFVASGLYLWWPRSVGLARAATPGGFANPPAVRRTHSALGLWLSAFLVVASITGFGIIRFDLASAFSAQLGRVAPVAAADDATCSPIGMDDAWNRALEAYPEHEIAMFLLPTREGAPYSVFMRPRGAYAPTRGDAEVRIDSRCGTILLQRDANTNRFGDTLLSYLIDLHNGRVLGVAGEALLVLLGLAAAFLPIFGAWAWAWRATGARKRRANIIN